MPNTNVICNYLGFKISLLFEISTEVYVNINFQMLLLNDLLNVTQHIYVHWTIGLFGMYKFFLNIIRIRNKNYCYEITELRCIRWFLKKKIYTNSGTGFGFDFYENRTRMPLRLRFKSCQKFPVPVPVFSPVRPLTF